METLLSGIKRRWRSHGFGIHSPFAYHFVTEVLCPGAAYGYYSYSLTADRHMRLLIRLLAYFNPGSVSIRMAEPGTAQAVVRTIVPKAVSEGHSPDFIVTDRPLATVCNALVLGREAVGALAMLPREYGMMFSNGRDCAILVALPYLPSQDFEIRL